jgi:foldase protein PrsA
MSASATIRRRVSRRMRTVACLAAIATAVGVGACGSSGQSVPAGDIATVGDAHVTMAQFNHWILVANNSQYVNTGETPVSVPVPPDYAACVASERARSASGTSTASLESECSQLYSEEKGAAEGILVEGIWFQGEAVDRHIKVSQASVTKAFNLEKAEEFPTKTKLDDFLSESGYTVADLRWVEYLNLIEEAIVKQADASAKHVTAAQIAAYYRAHASEYTQPERRNIELVLAKTAAIAATVKSALAGGAKFATVAKQYSIDPTTKDNGGVEDGVEQGEETPAFSDAIFAAPVNKLEGPIKTAFGYYVFEVTESLAKTVEPLKTASSAIKLELQSSGENTALDKLRSSFEAKWKARTTCASSFLDSSICGNAPASSSTGSSGTT